VVRLNARLERPNPNYEDREAIEQIIEGANLKMIRFIMSASDDALDGIDLDDAFVRQVVAHGQEYGEVKATGEIDEAGKTRQVEWRSDVEGVPPETEVAADPATREAYPEALRTEVLQDEPGGSQTVDDWPPGR
jgi:hypothetical protein